MIDTRNFGRYSWGDFIENCPANWCGAPRNNLSNRHQSLLDQSLRSLKFFIALTTFLERLQFSFLNGTEVSCLRNMRLDVKCKQSESSAGQNDLANRDQNFGYWPLQSLVYFFKHLPFWDLRGTEMSCLSKMTLHAKCKERLSSVRRNNLKNRDYNSGYRLLQA